MKRSVLRAILPVLATLWLTGTVAYGQFPQYTPPGSGAESPPNTAEAVKKGAEEARWRIGPVRLGPAVRIRDVGYVGNVYATPETGDRVSDFKAKFELGLGAYLFLGPKAILSGFAASEYNWWQEQKDLRQFNTSGGAGIIGDFNRLKLELSAQRLDRQDLLNSELEVPTESRTDRAVFAFELDVRGPFSLFGSAGRSRISYPESGIEALPELNLTTLERDEEVVGAGLQFELSPKLTFGLGAEYSKVDFREDPGGRSNSGTGPLAKVSYAGNRFEAELTTVNRDLEFQGDSAREDFKELTGSLRTRWSFSRRAPLSLYASRHLTYSALDEDAFFVSERIGILAAITFSRRIGLSAFGETGYDEFSSEGGPSAGRVDDFTAYGVLLDLQVTERFRLSLGPTSTDYDSNLPDLDRSTNTFRLSLNTTFDLFVWQ